MAKTKLCKYCRQELPPSAKVCPNCKRKQGGLLKWIIIIIIILLVLIVFSGGKNNESSNNTSSNSSATNYSIETKETIEYIVTDLSEMNDMLNDFDDDDFEE